jgi:hypothetical protein
MTNQDMWLLSRKNYFVKIHIIDIDSLKQSSVVAFGLPKDISNDNDLRMLMGMELDSLRGFKGFMDDYEMLSYRSGYIEDDAIKKSLITRMTHPILEKVCHDEK